MNKQFEMFTDTDCLKPTCNRKLPSNPLHFVNVIATENGYCSWGCMVSHLDDKAYEILEEVNKKAAEERNGKT